MVMYLLFFHFFSAFFLYLLLICIDLSPAPQFADVRKGESSIKIYNTLSPLLIVQEMKSKWHFCPGREIIQAEGL